MSSPLSIVSRYLAGEFDNKEQAMTEPAWFVHLRLWHRPVHLFADDSLTLFAEQSNALKLDQPYRQRLLRVQECADPALGILQVQYYGFRDPSLVKGAGLHPERLQNVTLDQVEKLPGCVLYVNQQDDRFIASPRAGDRCCFQYQGETRQVVLGFEVSPHTFLSYDKGVDLETGQALWGALMGAYRFARIR